MGLNPDYGAMLGASFKFYPVATSKIAVLEFQLAIPKYNGDVCLGMDTRLC